MTKSENFIAEGDDDGGETIVAFQTWTQDTGATIKAGAVLQGKNFGVLAGGEYGIYGISTPYLDDQWPNEPEKAGVFGANALGGYGVIGKTSSNERTGVWGDNNRKGFGVKGSSRDGPGIGGTSINNDGVVGESKTPGRSGVWGNNTAPDGFGVSGSSVAGVGVQGISRKTEISFVDDSDDGVRGETSNKGKSGVWGNNTGEGFGVSGSSVSGPGIDGRSISGPGVNASSNKGNGVTGFSTNRFGVVGSSKNESGIYGHSTTNYGGTFEGEKAQVRLVPNRVKGPPDTGEHRAGELFVDSEVDLYFCTQSGTPGTWKRVQLV
jgi:hypothetical protein